MYGLTLVTAPTIEPVDITEAREQCGIAQGNGAFDHQLLRLIKTARVWVEQRTDRALITQTWDYKFSCWPYGLDPIYVPKAPLSSVTSITYYDTAGASQTLATSVYKVLSSREPGEIRLKASQSWVSLYNEPDVITIRFVAGYGSTTTSVPEPLRHAMLMLISHWFTTPSAVLVGSISKEIEFAVEALLASCSVGSEFHSYAS